MKKIRKMVLIFSLSFYLVAVLTPQKEKEAHAFAITTTMVLGGLALAGAGGAIAYNSSSVMQEVGASALQKLLDQGVNVAEMLRINQFGLNQTMTNALADSMQETAARFSGKRFSIPAQTIYPSESISYDLPASLFKSGTETMYLIKHAAANKFSTDRVYLKFVENSTYYMVAVQDNADNVGGYWTYRSASESIYRYLNNNTQVNNAKYLEIMIPSHVEEPVRVSADIIQFDSTYEKNVLLGLDGVPNTFTHSSDIPVNYREIVANNYAGTPTVSVDYERLENIMSGASSEQITMQNMSDLLTSLETSIDAGFEGQTAILTTIWNGIKNIPALIQSSSTAVLGGISSLSDDLLTGLGTFTGNITKANEQLWKDAGVVWSGMTAAIENVGTKVGESVTGALTGIDDLLRDTTATIREIPGKISTGVTDGLTGIDDLLKDATTTMREIPGKISTGVADGLTGMGDLLRDTTATIREIPGTISTSVTDVFTSAFALPEDYFTTRITTIQQILGPKLPKLPKKEALFPSQYEEMGDWPGISADFSHYGIGVQKVVDNEAPNYYRRQIKLWISAILYFFTALFVIRRIAGVINK